MAISETKGQGWRAIPTQWRKASDTLTPTLATFLFSSHIKNGKRSRGSFKVLRWRLQQGETIITPQDNTKSSSTKTWIPLEKQHLQHLDMTTAVSVCVPSAGRQHQIHTCWCENVARFQLLTAAVSHYSASPATSVTSEWLLSQVR